MSLSLATHIALKFSTVTYGVAMVRQQDQGSNRSLHAAMEYNKTHTYSSSGHQACICSYSNSSCIPSLPCQYLVHVANPFTAQIEFNRPNNKRFQQPLLTTQYNKHSRAYSGRARAGMLCLGAVLIFSVAYIMLRH